MSGATGAMAPKLRAAAQFVERTGRRAAIGALTDIAGLVEGTAGTSISCERPDPRPRWPAMRWTIITSAW